MLRGLRTATLSAAAAVDTGTARLTAALFPLTAGGGGARVPALACGGPCMTRHE